MKLSDAIKLFQKVLDEIGDVDIVYPFRSNPDYSDSVTPELLPDDSFYIGFVDNKQTRLTTKPVDPLADKPVFVID